jgi:hypothetical protein
VDVTPVSKSLISFLQPIDDGEIVLPVFQRPFVWMRDDIKDFLVSILKGYFVGSFLFIDVDSENTPFAFRSIEGVRKKPEELRPKYMILDGQQRLTSLYYAFACPEIPLKFTKKPYKFYLDLNNLINDDIDNAISSKRCDQCSDYDNIDNQFEKRIIPFSRINDWDKWIEEYIEKIGHSWKNEDYKKFIRFTLPRWSKYINTLRNAKVTIIQIPKVHSDDNKGISEVCAIFEKMNSTGVRLTVFDLLAARLFKFKDEKGNRISLQDLWLDAIKNHLLIEGFSNGETDLYGVFALRFIALKRDLEVKGKTIINLERKDFETDWELAIDYIEKALRRIIDTADGGFGAINSRWMPYTTMVPVLAALLWKIDNDRLDHRSLKYVQKWYWSSVFLERYAGAVETTTKRDYDDLIEVFKDPSYIPDAFAEVDREILKNTGFNLKETARINSIYKGVMNLIALEGAKDFRMDISIELSLLDDHHIFPQAYLKSIKDKEMNQKYSKDKINCVLNRTLISTETNKSISGKKPSEYVQSIIPLREKERILKSHFINKDAIEKMESKSDEFEAFIELREREILLRLREKLDLSSMQNQIQ